MGVGLVRGLQPTFDSTAFDNIALDSTNLASTTFHSTIKRDGSLISAGLVHIIQSA